MPLSLAFIRLILSVMLKYIPMLVGQRISALQHRLTYKLLPPSTLQNVVVLGGSYTGIHLARRLAESLPTGFTVVLIERKTYFNHLFNFPRYAVVQGREERAFIPYDNVGNGSLVPEGIFEHVTGTVTEIQDEQVQLSDESSIPFAYLAICTGATLPRPATLRSADKEGLCKELRDMQMQIGRASKIAVVGGGAVGVQIAGDIKSFYPEKAVVIVHSRERLLNGFGESLSEYVEAKLEELGVRVVLGERPQLKGGDANVVEVAKLVFKDGWEESFDLVVCSLSLFTSLVAENVLTST